MSVTQKALDVLIVDEMGKNISGTGMDTNVIGRMFVPGVAEDWRPNITAIVVLDLATVQGTLIADADGVYDPREYNDRLLLGLRGMLSEAELHLLRLRLDAGRLRQVERGVYRQHLPTGLERLADGQVVKDADLQVQRTLLLVFERFTQLGSCQKVMRSFRDEGLLLPRRQHSGLDRGCVIWKRASDAALYDILRNPAYAGAFVYGRHAPHPVQRGGRRTRVINRAPADWRAVHYDVYPAYISWEQYLANQARLTDNANRYNLRTRGAPRSGAALLAWLGMPAEKFLKTREGRAAKTKADPMAMISTYLRASKELDKKTAEALENIIQVAWRNLKQS